MHPAVSLAFFLFFVATALWSLDNRRARFKWWIIHREDHPTFYWFLVGSEIVLVVLLPILCLEDWREFVG